MSVPACAAVIEHEPVPDVIVIVAPDKLHAPLAETVTASPELDEAATWNDAPNTAVAGAPVNVTDWVARVAAIVRITAGAALKLPFPPCVAVTVHVPVPLVIVTVLPLAEQAPLAAMETGSPGEGLPRIGMVNRERAAVLRSAARTNSSA